MYKCLIKALPFTRNTNSWFVFRNIWIIICACTFSFANDCIEGTWMGTACRPIRTEVVHVNYLDDVTCTSNLFHWQYRTENDTALESDDVGSGWNQYHVLMRGEYTLMLQTPGWAPAVLLVCDSSAKCYLQSYLSNVVKSSVTLLCHELLIGTN